MQGDELIIDSHNAIVIRKSKKLVKFYTCYMTSIFNTFCEFKTTKDISPFGTRFIPVLKPFNDLFFGLEHFINPLDDKEITGTNLWYWSAQTGWNYEYYPQEILEVGHLISGTGQIYLGIMMKDKILWSVFFSDWTLGSFRTQIFQQQNLESSEFCPQSISTTYDGHSKVEVISKCDKSIELYRFEVMDLTEDEIQEGKLNIPKVTFRSSKSLFDLQDNAKMCILKNEILTYDIS